MDSSTTAHLILGFGVATTIVIFLMICYYCICKDLFHRCFLVREHNRLPREDAQSGQSIEMLQNDFLEIARKATALSRALVKRRRRQNPSHDNISSDTDSSGNDDTDDQLDGAAFGDSKTSDGDNETENTNPVPSAKRKRRVKFNLKKDDVDSSSKDKKDKKSDTVDRNDDENSKNETASGSGSGGLAPLPWVEF